MFSPMLVVCTFRDLTKCLRPGTRLEQILPKKKKVIEYIQTHVMCIELCVTSWQSQAVSGSQKVRERVIGSREYI